MIDVDLDDERVPANARRLARLAIERGLDVRLTFAEWEDENPRHSEPELSLAVRMRRPPARKFAWVGMFTQGRFAWGGTEFDHYGYRQLVKVISEA